MYFLYIILEINYRIESNNYFLVAIDRQGSLGISEDVRKINLVDFRVNIKEMSPTSCPRC